MEPLRTIVITGPTATGKTRLGVKLCQRFNGEIISVDSRQVYRGLDIGSGKDVDEYGSGENRIKYHLIDIVEPQDEYNLARFLNDAEEAIKATSNRGRVPFLVGGSVLYLNALLNAYRLPGAAPADGQREKLRNLNTAELQQLLRSRDPEVYANLQDAANRTRLIRAIEKLNAPQRTTRPDPLLLTPLVIGTYYPRKTVHQRIEARLNDRLENGMIEEVKHLHEQGLPWERLEFLGLEYRYVALFLQQKITYPELQEKLLIKIRQFAKSQDVWFRKLERSGIPIYWIKNGDHNEAGKLAKLFLEQKPLPEISIRLNDIHYGPKSS